MNTNTIHILRPRLLLAGALALLSAAVIRSQTVPTPTLSWDSGVSGGVVTDTSGNNHNGTLSGNTAAGVGLGGSASGGLTGFTTSTSYVSYDMGETGPLHNTGSLHNGSATVSLWFENPTPPGSGRMSLFTIGSIGSGLNRTVGLWLTSAGGNSYTLNLGYQGWSGATQSFTSSTLTINPDSWYNLAFVWSKAANNGGDTQLYNVTVYLTAQGAAGLNTTPVLSTVVGTGFGSTGPANGNDSGNSNSRFYVGANASGYYAPFYATGAFGGSIDDVSLWQGTALTADQLNSVFQTAAVPEPSACALLAGAAIGLCAFLVRHRRRS